MPSDASKDDHAKDAPPDYLQSYDALAQHFRAHLDGLLPIDKGRRFAKFVQRLVPQTEAGRAFDTPDLSEKESHDEGVDLTARGKDGSSLLHVQAKLWIDRVETLDNILSKFLAFSRATGKAKKQSELFPSDQVPRHFLIATLSPLENIRHRYEERELSSRQFYDELVRTRRLSFCDGTEVLGTLKAAYDKLAELPSRIVLNLETDAITKDSVYLGIINGRELRALYTALGDSLFFENIRDFVGIPSHLRDKGRSSPNSEILKTLHDSPARMLERNNGIVFRADEVGWGESRQQLVLTRGSVVNGCQTTMCIVTAESDACSVPVKVVQSADSWAIAKAANYQNSVPDIDLDLARHVRPQLAKRAAARAGVQLHAGQRSAFEIIDSIYDQRVTYDETRSLYIALFSKTPNNAFAGNYTELLAELIDRFYREDPYGDSTFDTLFLVQAATQEALRRAQQTFTSPAYAGLFDRLYKDDNPSYRSFISVLALCGAAKMNVAERQSDMGAEYARMCSFLGTVRVLIASQKDTFTIYYLHAAKIWMQEVMPPDAEDAEIRRDMSVLSRRINFSNAYRKLCMEADVDERLRGG